MIKYDTHIHTYPFSQDSHQRVEELMKINNHHPYGMILTEHMDYNYSGSDIKFEFNPKEYFASYLPYRNDRFLLGVEMGLQMDNLDSVKRTVDSYPFDMVIGAIHCVNGDIAFPDYYNNKSKQEAYSRYLDTMLSCIERYHDFDTLAHIDYMCRYATYDDPELHVCDHRLALEAIFNFIIDHDICLEINTRRLGTENGYQTMNEILRLYHFLGGRYVTVGSDAHYVENVSMNFDKADCLIRAYNFIPVYFKERKRME
ncbi:MAG: histidinol-phosphatase HisJ family protein [Lachnospiraceae bacterium]|nr:histidinol-phosphatase HisJ family protein [Lachnospiraceae bacterium]